MKFWKKLATLAAWQFVAHAASKAGEKLAEIWADRYKRKKKKAFRKAVRKEIALMLNGAIIIPRKEAEAPAEEEAAEE